MSYPFILITTGGTVTFDSGLEDGDEILWVMDGDFPEGWWSTPAAGTLLDPASGDGQVLAGPRKSSKPLVLRAAFYVHDAVDWFAAANKLETMADSLVGANGTLRGNEPAAVKQLTVRMPPGGRLIGPARIGTITGELSDTYVAGGRFQIPLIAVNPAKTTV